MTYFLNRSLFTGFVYHKVDLVKLPIRSQFGRADNSSFTLTWRIAGYVGVFVIVWRLVEESRIARIHEKLTN